MPVDVAAFLEATPWLPLSLLWLMAQLWEPTGLEAVLRHREVAPLLRAQAPALSAEKLAVVLADVAL